MTIVVTYAAEGDAMPHPLTSRTAVNAQVATEMYEIAGAGDVDGRDTRRRDHDTMRHS